MRPTSINDAGDLIVDTTQRIFRDLGDPKSMQNAAQGQKLWQALDDAGLTRTWIPERLGGVGASIAEGFDVLRIAGQFAVSVPLAETLLAGWLLSRGDLAMPDGPITLAPVDPRDRFTFDGTVLSGCARAVPFARQCSQLVVLAHRKDAAFVASVNPKTVQLEAADNIAGESRDRVSLKSTKPIASAPSAITFEEVRQMGAAIRATQMAGALQGMLDLTVAYANERVAFTKPIGKFQAIQHSLARLAGEVAAAVAAAGSAADAIQNSEAFDDAVFLEIASAKIRVGEAVTTGTAIAHQVHGAIGFTDEHVLHRYTQRLWAWRDDFGGESEWAVQLGQRVASNGADALWPMLAAR